MRASTPVPLLIICRAQWHCIKPLIFPVSIKTDREDNALNHNSIDRFRVSPIIPPSRNTTSPSDHQTDEYPTLNPSFKVQSHSSAGSENDMMHQDVKLQTTQALSSRSRCTTAPQAFRTARISLQFPHRSSFVAESILSSLLCPGSPRLLTTELYPQRNSHTSASVSADQPSQISARCPQVLHVHSPPRPHYIGTTRQRVPRPSERRKLIRRRAQAHHAPGPNSSAVSGTRENFSSVTPLSLPFIFTLSMFYRMNRKYGLFRIDLAE
ncbi:hypothetical protein B0H17DRAFT_1189920 [Mycena rosella]|uniref:Uncharacterized protein n=1 Tax=Mycena rosella TaxID=1033263 RepID=A0AAD7F7J4_MYCRO|nr:hypothetical protein B0H17DRAFT_1189920 [Mycena rosella]